MRTRVKVKRSELLKVVEGRRRKAEAEHKRAMAAYPKRVAAWQAACVKTLEDALTKARVGKLQARYGRIELPDQPPRPSEGRDLCNLRRMEATLRIGAEDTVLLSQEDADYYFGPCNV